MTKTASGTASGLGWKGRGGFSLIEMTLALAIGMMTASAGVAMLSQHVSFNRIYHSFDFLREDAPQVNNLINRIVGQAVAYRVYGSSGDAFLGAGAVNTGGKAVRLIYRNPDGSTTESVLSFEPHNGVNKLVYYYNDGTGWPPEPAWVITGEPVNMTFANDTGILLFTLTGKNGEEITYAGTGE